MLTLQKKFLKFRSVLVPLLGLALSASAVAGNDKPFTSTVFRLSDFKGMTFYQFMEAKNGLHAALNADLSEPIDLIGLEKIKKIAKTEFDPQVFRKITALFKDGEAGFDRLFNALESDIRAGHPATMETIVPKLRNILSAQNLLKDSGKIGLAPLIVAPVITMGSGGGTTVVLDDSNFFLNYDYKLGPDDPGADKLIQAIMKKNGVTQAEATQTLEAAALKSGRNFGYSGSAKLLDFSDSYLLKEMDQWISKVGADEARKTWGAIFDILTNCDTSGLSGLSKESQGIVTGWLTVYTAELRRHTMVRMVSWNHPWENDLTEALIASVFVKENGGWMFAPKAVRAAKKSGATPKLVSGKPEDFFGIGTQGSGIGVNRMERRALQTLMTEALENSHPDEVAEIRKLIDKPKGDIFRGMMEFLNDPSAARQDQVDAIAGKLKQAFVDVMTILHDKKESKALLSYFTDAGADAPVMKKKFVGEICRSYLKP